MMCQDAKQLALQLMQKHQLKDWKFEFNSRKRSLGNVNLESKTIYLSSIYTQLNSEEIVKNVILHEIAHALLPKYENHGKAWKAKAIEIGCQPSRICTTCIRPIGKHIYECPNCKKQFHVHKRIIKRRRACKACCNMFNNRKFSEKFVLVEVK